MNLPALENHAPVTAAVFASAFTAVLIAVLKSRYGVDFSGQEANLQTLAIGVGYWVQSKLETK